MKATKIQRQQTVPPPPPPAEETPPPDRKKFIPRPRPTPPPEPVAPAPTIAIIRRPVIASTVRMEVCQTMAVDYRDLSGRTRHPRVVWARRVITRLCRIYTTLSFPEIAVLIGRPNHSSVITADQVLDRVLKLPHGHSLRAVPLDFDPGGKRTDVQDLLDAIAKNITRDPIVVAQPAQAMRQSA